MYSKDGDIETKIDNEFSGENYAHSYILHSIATSEGQQGSPYLLAEEDEDQRPVMFGVH